VNTGGQYPDEIAVEFINDKIDLVMGYAEGQAVEVSVNIRGRKWKDRYFVSLSGWKIAMQGTTTQVQPAQQAAPLPAQVEDELGSELPF